MAEKNDGCSDPKRSRFCTDRDLIFSEFYADEKLMTDLKVGISAFQEWNEYCLCMLKIRNCNGAAPCTFRKAFCETERYECEHRIINSKIVKKYSFASIFKHGVDLLSCFVKPKKESCLPQRRGARLAFAKLLHFLSKELKDAERTFKRNAGNVPESEWSVILAHHLLSRLSLSPFYVIDNAYKKGNNKCPCRCEENLSGTYGDTSVGSPEVWHGYVDIMMGVSIKISFEEPDSPLSGRENHSSVEVKTKDLKTSREQIIAQSIVFSFFQKKLNPDYENHLIPSIGISKEKLIVYFYDCDNDILLESSEIPLIGPNGALLKPSIIALWLVLNFKYFCTGITKGMKNSGFSASFTEVVSNKLNHYKDVTAPCELSYPQEEEMWTWGGRPENDEPDQIEEDVNKLGPWIDVASSCN